MCLATDLGMAFPFEHGLDATVAAIRLADSLGVDSTTMAETYYACLLMYAGCTTDLPAFSPLFPGGGTANVVPVQFGTPREAIGGVLRAMAPPEARPWGRAWGIARRIPRVLRFQQPHFTAICEVAEMLAAELGMPPSVHRLFRLITERWDGKSILKRAAGDEVPLPVRILHVARDATFNRLSYDLPEVVDLIRTRSGGAFDPTVAGRFVAEAGDLLHLEGISSWDLVMALEPKPHLMLEGEAIDRALAAVGHFSDLVSPFLSAHSDGTARLAAEAARVRGLSAGDRRACRRAGLIHDVGRVAVDPLVWQREGPLAADAREQVRLHPYHTERVFHRSPFLSELASAGGAHHERLDGSGYHRGAIGSSLSELQRLIAAADCFHAMTEPRPHRPALTAMEAARTLNEEASKGLFDADAAAAVTEAAGEPTPEIKRPAGLTGREVEVVGLVARGLLTKQIASSLGISTKTADRHIQNAYRKMEVSTRAAATVFAMEHGLVARGQSRIER
jgi:HD-GYP domain-containing protein (c-di-GMP phosphodiesterase class II)/DNA-binding CsgD family transcriptional regulator